MGYVIQDGGLFPHLTAKSNILLMAHELGWTRTKREARLAELVELTHFPADGLSRYPAQLSGGQKQRVGIMRGLLLDPDVILLDEPLGALDPIIRHNLQTELRGIFQTLGKTVVLVTHDVAEAKYFGDEILLMRRGRIVQRGSFDDLVNHPAEEFVTNFIQSPRGLDDSEMEIEAMKE
jgi:osmoprotectant transport system ATP-binding protein